MASTGYYLYAILEGEPLLVGLTGIDGVEVQTVLHKGFSAVVSEIENKRIRPERRKLSAHFQVLKAVTGKHNLLPMAFGIIADSAEEVERVLAANHEQFAEQLDRVRGRIEMGLRVAYDVSNLTQHLIAQSPELQSLRDQTFAPDREPSQDDLMQVGRAYDRLLAQKRQETIERIVSALGTTIAETKENKLKSEKDIANLAFLIAADGRAAFENAVAGAAELFGEDIVFELTGPFAPHNFIELTLSPPDEDDEEDDDEGAEDEEDE